MNIIVLIKEVPDMQMVKFDRERGVVNRASASAEINPFDLNALQAGLEIKKQTNGTMTVITMGPKTAEKSLRDAYARGADHVILLSDRKFGGADTLATSFTLSCGVRKSGDFDLIICGEKTVDGDTAQVGPEVAEAFGIPHACYVDEVKEISKGAISVNVSEIAGRQQLKTLALPALICVTKNVSTPKLPTVDRKLESLDIEVEVLDYGMMSDVMTEDQIGGNGSPTKVRKIELQEKPERSGITFKEDLPGFMNAFVRKMEELGIE